MSKSKNTDKVTLEYAQKHSDKLTCFAYVDNKEVHNAMLFERKKFLFFSWYSQKADLQAPVRKKEQEIADTERKLKKLKDELKSAKEERDMIMRSIEPGVFYDKKLKPSSSDDGKDKQKTRTLKLATVPARPEHNNNGKNNNQRKN